MGPSFGTHGTLALAGIFRPGAVQSLDREAPVSEVIEAFLGNQIPNKATARGYRRHLNNAMALIGVEALGEIQPVMLQSFRQYLLADGRGSATHAQALIALRSFLKWVAAMDGHDMRMDTVEYLLKVPKVEVITPHEIMTDKEILAFIEAAGKQGPRDLALVLVGLGSGVRVAELVALDVRDIRHDAGGGTVIHVRQGKGGKDRLIPVRKEVAKAVEAYLKAGNRDRNTEGPLFLAEDRAVGLKFFTRLTTRSATRVIKEAAERANIRKRITPHCLRHTFAFSSYLYCRDLMAVQKLLGHATVATTMRYVSHLDQLDLRKAIPAFLAGGKGPRVRPSAK